MVSGNFFCPACAAKFQKAFLCEVRGSSAARSVFVRVLCHRCNAEVWCKIGEAVPASHRSGGVRRVEYVGFDPEDDPDWARLSGLAAPV